MDERSNGVPGMQLPLSFVPIGHPDTMMSEESVRRAVEEFEVRPTDVIVATFSKTGTTLVTWLCHLIRVIANDKGFDFTAHLQNLETFYQVVPWPLLSWDIGYDPNKDGSQFNPRVFKSHLRMASIYRGCKYIVTVRDPANTTLSFYNFMLTKHVPSVLELDSVSTFLMETPFVKGRSGRASLWEFYQEYHALKDCKCVLILVYEDLINDMKEGIQKIAGFINKAGISDECASKVESMSTKNFMARYNSLFDEPYDRAKELGRVGDLSQLSPGAKVATKAHEQTFNESATQFLRDKWKQSMAPLGYITYGDFAEAIRERNRRLFP